MKGIIFSGDPIFGDTVKLLVLSPPGIPYDTDALAEHFYGVGNWHFNDPPMKERTPQLVPAELLSTPLFRYSSVGLEWEDFLNDVYDSVDFVLFFNSETRQMHEVSLVGLLDRSPANFAFSFFDISRNKPLNARRRSMIEDKVALAVQTLAALLEDGWSVAAIAKGSGLNQITLHNIKNLKATRISDRVFDKLYDFRQKAAAGEVQKSTRGRATSSAARPAGKALVSKKSVAPSPQANSLINTNYVSVDITQLQSVIDRLIENFSDAITELQSLRGMLKR